MRFLSCPPFVLTVHIPPGVAQTTKQACSWVCQHRIKAQFFGRWQQRLALEQRQNIAATLHLRNVMIKALRAWRDHVERQEEMSAFLFSLLSTSVFPCALPHVFVHHHHRLAGLHILEGGGVEQ